MPKDEDELFCEMDEVMGDVARDALKNFALISGSTKSAGRIMRASKAMQRLFKYGPQVAFPHNIDAFFGERTSGPDTQKFKAAMENGGSFDADLLLYKSTGSTFWSNLQMEPILDQTGGQKVSGLA
jgi:PAS domain-containing protein